jgi:alpha-tubulin suppressor-like RCC1 family protein
MTFLHKTKKIYLKPALLFSLLVFSIIFSGCSSATYSVSGKITIGGQPLQGVTMTLAGKETRTTTTDAGGNFYFGDVDNGDYTLIPTKDGFVFYPFNRPVYLGGIDAVGFNFSATSLFHIATNTHSLFQKLDGTAYSWGDNTHGQLGDGSTTNSNAPAKITSISGATAVATGDQFSVALLNDGTVWAWGQNDFGQLGDGSTTESHVPVQVVGLSGVMAVAAGSDFALALRGDGTVWAWGHNDVGQLGNVTLTDSSTPVQVTGFNITVAAISAGYNHCIALDTVSTVWTWGSNSNGQIGNGADPATVPYYNTAVHLGVGTATAVAAGNCFSIAVTRYRLDTIVYSWGLNNFGQLGVGNTIQYNAPVGISNFSGTMTVSAGFDHVLAVKTDGSVWSWGNNDHGQLGVGSSGGISVSPVAVGGISAITSVSAGVGDSMVMDINNAIWAWGRNDFGQVGDGSNTDRTSPVSISVP